VAALPPLRAGGVAPLEAARLWLEACVRFPVDRQLLLGEPGALRRDLLAARDALGVNVELGAPEPVAPPERGPTLPGPRGVIR
jgi:hypothetical protein